MPYIADRVWETNSATGTSAFVLTGAKSGYQAFSTAFGSSSRVVGYCAINGAEWEVGKGTFNGTTGLTRDFVRSSSNSGTLVTFSAAPEVFVTASSELIDNSNIGMQMAMRSNWALP